MKIKPVKSRPRITKGVKNNFFWRGECIMGGRKKEKSMLRRDWEDVNRIYLQSEDRDRGKEKSQIHRYIMK